MMRLPIWAKAPYLGPRSASRRAARKAVLAAVAAAALVVQPAPDPPLRSSGLRSMPAAAQAQPGWQPAQAGTFFMGRLRYGQNAGNDCGNVGMGLIRLLSTVATIRVTEERRLSPTDPQLFDTPFLYMNGHFDFVLADADIASLRTYFEHGGFLLASECCSNPAFPQAWRREFGRIFPGEPIRTLRYTHPIYRSLYRIQRIRCLHEPRDVVLEGLFRRGRLVAVLCGDGLCCASSMGGTCNRGRGISPENGRKLALNIAVYALTH